MQTLYKWIVLTVLILAAMASYSYGFSEGVFLFVIVGVVFELSFWFRLFRKSL